MAVLFNNREVAFTEFERQMGNICRELQNRINALPARYKKYLSRRIYEPASKAYSLVILANERGGKDNASKKRRQGLFEEALNQLTKLQKPMLSYWNLRRSSDGGMEQIKEMIRREFALIYGVIGREESPPLILTLPRKKGLLFLENMQSLHRYTYQKIGHTPNEYVDFVSMQLAELVDSALYHVVFANCKMPETKAEAEKRANHIKCAVDCLNGMQRPMLALWNVVDYSDNTMNEWSGLLNEEIKLLEGLKKSDATRYNNLK